MPSSPETSHERELRLFIYELAQHIYKVQYAEREILDPTTFEWVTIPCHTVPPDWFDKREDLMIRLRRLTA